MKSFKFIILTVCLSFLFSYQTKAQGLSCPKTEKKIGLQMYSVRDSLKKDFKGTIAALSAMGFKDLEAANYKDGKFYGLTPEDFKAELEAVGLNALSSHAGIPLAADVSKTDWNEIWKWWDTCIAAHKAAGIKYLVVPWLALPKTLADLKAYCDYYNQVGEKCNQAGISFGYHNHAQEFQKVEGEIMYDFMLKNTDPEKVFFEMDVYWTVMGQKSPVNYFKTYPGRFKALHIKDEKELGESGMVGFDAIYRNIETAGTIYSIIEVERYDYPPLESVKMSLEYLETAPF
ncbi:MAG: sugar phosphate isomerase/epimerase [Candidatus Azobacteroides sp.]|nr:sugar phosphate isomerase/epimerase [Candidatus Azobacteroides sp.]